MSAHTILESVHHNNGKIHTVSVLQYDGLSYIDNHSFEELVYLPEFHSGYKKD